MSRLTVNLVVPAPGGAGTGIGRYATELGRALVATGVTVQTTSFRYLPGTRRRPVLRTLPIGFEETHGGLDHLTRIMGAAVLLGRRLRPSVVTAHDLGALYCPEDLAITNRLDRGLFGLSLLGMRRADHVIAVSDFTRDCLLRAGFASRRVTTVHHGIDHAQFRPNPGGDPEPIARLAADYGLDLTPDEPIVLYVGNEQPRKNLATLIAALARLKRTGLAWRFVKVGAPGYPPGRRQLCRLLEAYDLTANVAIVDRVADGDLPRFYRAASVYVQPSVWEGFGLPVVEAMACGTPVVAADAAAVPEICGSAAMLVDPRSSDEVADGIAAVLGEPGLRERLRRAGLRRAGEFTWSATAAKTRSVYELL